MPTSIKALMGSPKTAGIFALDPLLKKQCQELIDLDFKKTAWKIAAIACLVLSGGLLFHIAAIFYCMSKHYAELFDTQTSEYFEKSLKRTTRDMQVDLERGCELEIDGVVYRHDPAKQTSEDLVKEIIRQLLVVRKLDKFQLLLATKFAHQGTASLSLQFLREKCGDRYPVVGRAYTRHVTITTKGKDVFIRSIDKGNVIETSEKGMLNEEGSEPKPIKMTSELNFQSKKIKLLFSNDLEVSIT